MLASWTTSAAGPVVKADGLAAGKGVTVAPDRGRRGRGDRGRPWSTGAFGDAGAHASLVEEFLEGPEVSAFALVDAASVVPLALAQDFKRVGDGDTGPEHRRHGRVLAAAVARPDDRARIWGVRRRATVGAAPRRGDRVLGAPLHGRDAHRGRAQGPRVQLPVRRPGDPGRSCRGCAATSPSLLARARGTGSATTKVDLWPTTPRHGGARPRGGYPGTVSRPAPRSTGSDAAAAHRRTPSCSMRARPSARVEWSRKAAACSR